MAIVESEAEVMIRCWAMRDRVNDPACRIRLIKADIPVNPATALSSFTEANYPGYAALPTRHKFADPEHIALGIYETRSVLFHFEANAGGPQIVYGWLITLGADWLYYDRFADPLAVQPGSPIDVWVQLRAYARQIFPCSAEGET